METVQTLLLVCVNNDLGVALTAEAVTGSLQCLAQLAEVVDLAIEDEPHRAVLIGQRLMTCFAQIDDAQPPVAQGDTLAQVMTLVIWSAMRYRRGHPRDQIAIRPRESGYSAHTNDSIDCRMSLTLGGAAAACCSCLRVQRSSGLNPTSCGGQTC